MDNPMLQLLVLGGIAIFLILRLRSVLGTREGYERPPEPARPAPERRGPVAVPNAADPDITDHVPANSVSAQNLAAMKRIEPDFNVTEFLTGARQAYEMIVMGFERGELDDLRPLLGPEVLESFEEVIQVREREGLRVEATFIGVREVELAEARFSMGNHLAELTVRFTGELTSVVRDGNGTVVEGDPHHIKQQRDRWTFARRMGAENPNWQLVATGD